MSFPLGHFVRFSCPLCEEEEIVFPFEFDAQTAAMSARAHECRGLVFFVVLLRRNRTGCGRVCVCAVQNTEAAANFSV